MPKPTSLWIVSFLLFQPLTASGVSYHSECAEWLQRATVVNFENQVREAVFHFLESSDFDGEITQIKIVGERGSTQEWNVTIVFADQGNGTRMKLLTVSSNKEFGFKVMAL